MSKLISQIKLRKLCSLLGLFLALSLSVGIASAQMDAYSVQVAVSDRSAAEQQSAYLLGMRSVLLANSGDKTLLNRDDVRAGLRQAENYVESFRYNAPAPGTVISPDTPLTDSVRQSGQATQLMLIQFNRQLIDQLIRPDPSSIDSEEPVEGFDPFADVSSALMWLIVEDGGRQMLISANAGQNVMERVREIAGGAGISLSFPAGDETDQRALSADDIKTAALDNVSTAASRYAQPITLAAHLVRTRTGSWDSVWLKVAAGEQQQQAYTSKNLDEALQEGVAWLSTNSATGSIAQSDYQANATGNTSSAEALIWVSPLRTTKGYAQVMSFLDSLEGVSVAYPKEISTAGAVFAIVPRSAVQRVANAAGSQDWLRQSVLPSSASQSRFAAGISVAFEYLR